MTKHPFYTEQDIEKLLGLVRSSLLDLATIPANSRVLAAPSAGIPAPAVCGLAVVGVHPGIAALVLTGRDAFTLATSLALSLTGRAPDLAEQISADSTPTSNKN